MSKYSLRCMSCSRTFEPAALEYTCPDCGPRMGTLEVVYDFDRVREEYSHAPLDTAKDGIWAFDFLLPLESDHFRPELAIGNTPLYSGQRLARKYGLAEVLIKDDGRNPTASFKDRASALAVAKAKEKGYDTLFCASTGNAASSLAGVSTVSALASVIFVPASAPAAKLIQLQVYGSKVLAIRASYDTIFDLSMEIGLGRGWYSRNSAVNPYLLEGKKTCALELAFELDFDLPDYIFVSAGDGTVLSSFYKGFSDLKKLGLLGRIPTVVGVQASGAAAIKLTYERGFPFEPVDTNATSAADSISVGKPRDVVKACTYTRDFKGLLIAVSDEEILESIIELAREGGVFAEPAGAAALAGMKSAVHKGLLTRASRIALVITGNGLKDLKSPSSVLPPLVSLEPKKELIEEALDEN